MKNIFFFYLIKNGNNDLSFDDILIRVSENKYLIAGKNISIKIKYVILQSTPFGERGE